MSAEATPFQRSGRPKTAIRCGTISGWTKHVGLDEKPCDACATAKREYDHRRNSADDRKQQNRLSAKAQRLALQRLSHVHPDEYRALYLAAKAEVSAQADDVSTSPAGGDDRG